MAGQLDVFQHYGKAFHMYGKQVGIFQEANQVVFHCLLQHHDCVHLQAQVASSTILGYLMN